MKNFITNTSILSLVVALSFSVTTAKAQTLSTESSDVEVVSIEKDTKLNQIRESRPGRWKRD